MSKIQMIVEQSTIGLQHRARSNRWEHHYLLVYIGIHFAPECTQRQTQAHVWLWRCIHVYMYKIIHARSCIYACTHGCVFAQSPFIILRFLCYSFTLHFLFPMLPFFLSSFLGFPITAITALTPAYSVYDCVIFHGLHLSCNASPFSFIITTHWPLFLLLLYFYWFTYSVVEQLSLKLMNMVNIKNSPNAVGKNPVPCIPCTSFDRFWLTHSYIYTFSTP